VKPGTNPITLNATIGGADPLEIRSGPAIVPIERLKLFSPSDWEGFVNEWASSLPDYGLVERTSGAGDMGCDVVATVDALDPTGPWDNYQCKHYDHPLAPSDVWLELAKLCYYTFIGAYSVPRRYAFVAPRGVGTKLTRLLKKPAELKAGLFALWEEKCATDLVEGRTIALDSALTSHIDAIDFRIFGHVPTQRLIEEHAKTRYFAVRFGLGLPPRPPSPAPPSNPSAAETRYVQQLMMAYGDNLKRPVRASTDLDSRLARHFVRARESFYCAEALRNFSRDTLPDGAFEHLQKQIYDGVVDVCEAPHTCGLTRVNATTGHAASLEITSSALLGRFEIADRHGICHQLANDDQLTWVPNDA
jgi:hypothetical protein